jgi:predicted ATPase/signal transduction histidine kinase
MATREFSIAEDSAFVLEPLCERADFTLYRGRERGKETPILAVAVAAAQLSSQGVRKLKHEFSLATELDAAWAAQPLTLTNYQGRTVLILKDPGGEPLDLVIERNQSQPIDLTRFLRIAIGLAQALDQVHRQGLVHKDVKPANAFVDDFGHVWLTGFAIASRLPRERLAPAPLEFIDGTFAYMSPEQTGRMNRSVDSRSDLYSLGVTLYQMLTGVLPFTAADPLEWVHCHIARQPLTPAERGAVPDMLSAIIMRLLAKNAEERYQAATGLEADLRRCLNEWQTHGHIEPFSIGADDSSDRLLIPEKLYGREREVDSLLATFDRVVQGGKPELVLVSGHPGVGKSAVVNELHKWLVPPRGLYASGKFDQYKRDIPFATVAQAFQSLIRPLLSKPEVELSKWRDDLHSALSPNGALLVDLVPELKLIIGEQPPLTALPAQEAKTRAYLALRRFLGVFARPEHPLALFLDDLQWLDPATLDFLEDLLVQQDLAHLLVVGAYRDNEVDAAHPLMRKLSAIRKAGAAIQEVCLAPLSSSDLAHLLRDTLRCESQSARSLAQLVYEKTAGNPFFAIQFIHALDEGGLIFYEHGDGRWRWDIKAIRAKGYTDNVVDLMVSKLNRLPAKTQRALQQFACIGNSTDSATLCAVLETSQQQTEAQLWGALREELVVRSDGFWQFAHDRFHEAAYSTIATELRAQDHLRIGRLLLAHTAVEKREESIFEIVNQLNRGVELITSEGERYQLAELNLLAGKRSKASTAYASALNYFIAGQTLLTSECWERRHDLAFQLELNRAECEFLTGELAVSMGRVETLRSLAIGAVELAKATCLGIDVYTTLGQIEVAVLITLEYLRSLAIDWPLHPTEEQARREYERIWSQLGNRAIEEVTDFPLMSDPTTIATLDVLTKVLPAAFFTDLNLQALIICRAASLSIENGNNDGSCLTYVWVSIIAGHKFGHYKEAFQFVQLGYDLVEKRGLKRFEAATYHSAASTMMAWMKHPRTCVNVLLQAFEIARRIGDVAYAGYSSLCLNSLLIAAGDPLAAVQSEAEKGLQFAQKAGFAFAIGIITPQLRLIQTLRGLTTRFGFFDDGTFDEIEYEGHLADYPLSVHYFYWILKLQARFYAGDFASAIEASLKARPLLSTSATFEWAEYEFFSALAHGACCNSTTADQSQEHFDALNAHYKQLVVWAEHCPGNFENRAALVGAEIARIEGRQLDAEKLYEDAIRSAHINGFVHNEALANELAAGFYRARGLEKVADAYLKDARSLYAYWGADGKVNQLVGRYPHLRADGASAAPSTIDPSTGQLDVETVVKSSQALSSEMVLAVLIEKLMRIAMEHAGAERSLLILISDGEPRIEAEATTGAIGIEVDVHQRQIAPLDLAKSTLHYVIRTQEQVLLDDASADNVYSKDEYVRHKRSKSVLCLPIVKQTKLIGALWLENNLTPFVFTPDRVTVLQLLSSQAAISLENAKLYSDLQLQVGILQQLPVSAWTLKPDGTPDFVNQGWLEFSGQTLDFIRSNPEAWMTAVHPEDREMAAKSFWEGVHSGQGFAFETRSLRAQDDTYRWHLQQAVVLRDAEGKVLKFVGTTTDIDDQKRIEDALRQSQGDLARINRVTTMGELTASLAHEISQPISGAITNANVCLRKLTSDTPDLDELRTAVTRFGRDARRAAEIIARIRSQFEKGSVNPETLGVSEMIQETVALLRDEAMRYNITVRTELAADLPQIVGDRVQLQQVAMNLIVNSIEAMKDVDGIREMVIRSQRAENEQILVFVSDTGPGFPPELVEQIFDPFFTTKPHGTGMGLRISRSIIESHGGRLWAESSSPRGATFHLSLPAAVPSDH